MLFMLTSIYYEKSAETSIHCYGVYFDRTAGRDRHHCHPRSNVAAGFEQGQDAFYGDIVAEQSEAAGPSVDYV